MLFDGDALSWVATRAEASSLRKTLFDERPELSGVDVGTYNFRITGLDAPEIIQGDQSPISVVVRQGEGMLASRKTCFCPKHLPCDLTNRMSTI